MGHLGGPVLITPTLSSRLGLGHHSSLRSHSISVCKHNGPPRFCLLPPTLPWSHQCPEYLDDTGSSRPQSYGEEHSGRPSKRRKVYVSTALTTGRSSLQRFSLILSRLKHSLAMSSSPWYRICSFPAWVWVAH